MAEAIIFFTAGILLIVISFVLRKRFNNLLTNGFSTDGVIFDFEQDNKYNYPVVRFLTMQQEWITQRCRMSYVQGLLKKGQQVRIVYDLDDPSNFYIDNKWTRITPIILTISGIIAIVLGGLFLTGKLPMYN